MAFQPLSDNELRRLDDDALMAYVVAARAAENPVAVRQGVSVLAAGRLDAVRYRVALKVPQWAVDDVAQEALTRAIASAFDGHAVGQFSAWLDMIVRRTIADFHRGPQRSLEAVTEPIDDLALFDPAAEVEATGARLLLEEMLGDLSEAHRRVVVMLAAGLSAPEICERMPELSEANVNQIASRFRRRFRERLDGRL